MPPSPDAHRRDPADVVVVGAGIAGLTAALVLQGAGREVRVLEGAATIGGRVQGITDVDGRVLGDLGPTWVWPRWQPVVARWLDRLQLTTFAQYDAGDAVLEGHAPRPLRQPLPGQDGIARLTGGPSALVGALAARLDPARITTGAAVARIVVEGGGILAITRDGRAFPARHLVLATPLRATAEQIAIDGLAPGLTAALRAAPTWMAQQAKAVAFYPTPFWRAADLSGRIASRLGPLVEAHDHSPASGDFGAVFGFVGWDAAARAADPAGLTRGIAEQLARCLGAAPDRLVIQDWATRPLICSRTDRSLPPQHPDIGPDILRAAHLGGRLRFAVSESADTSPGLIEGALAAGEAAARSLLA